jgi:effector-binding domain-containing protein
MIKSSDRIIFLNLHLTIYQIQYRMKTLLKLLYLMLLIVILTLLAGLFLPKIVDIKCSKRIHAAPGLIYDQLDIMKNWEKWSPWMGQDKDLTFTFNNVVSGRGASYSWKSSRYGEGRLTISDTIRNKELCADIDFGEYGSGRFDFSLEESGNRTRLEWEFSSEDLAYFERYFMFILKKDIEQNMIRGLEAVKNLSEELRLSRISEPELLDLEMQPVMVMIDTVKTTEFNARQAAAFERIEAYLDRRKLEKTGEALTIYYVWDPDGESIFASGYPVSARTWGWRNYICTVIGGRVATVTHWGNYSSPKPYLALDEFLKENKLEADSFIWETYQVTPEMEKDTSKWEKRLFYPVR